MTGTCRYCRGQLSNVRRDRSRGPVHTEPGCRDKIDRRVAQLLSEGLTTVRDIAYHLDEEGVYDELSEYVVQNSMDRVKGGNPCHSNKR